MRRIKFSVLTILFAMPAMAGLPVVNLGAAGVSARAAFGENVSGHTTRQTSPQTRRVATRTATQTKNIAVANSSDVLVPNRPSNDLWAQNDVALRMPRADEYSIFGANDFALPEEDLDNDTYNVYSTFAAAPVASAPLSELDAQIARLSQLQKRADNSVRTASVQNRVIAAPIATQNDTPSRVVARQDTPRPVTHNFVEKSRNDDNVTLSRLVVPMDAPDVVVRAVEKNTSPRISAVREDMTKMSPSELRQAFRKTFLSENKHLSTFQIDDRFDVASDMSASIEGFTANHDLSEDAGVRTLEIKINFRNEDSALSRENYTLLTEYASIVVSNPKRAIQVSIPSRVTRTSDDRKLAARRLAIVEQVLRDTGVSEQRIMPVLANRSDDGFVLRIISSDQYETLTQSNRDIFGDAINKKTYRSMRW